MYDELKKLLEAKAAAHWEYIDGLEIGQLLALIAEVERLKREEKNDAIAYKAAIERQEELRVEFKEWQASHHANYCKAADERDQLKAENESLRKDKDRLDALESNFWDVRHNSHPIADTGDSSSSLEIVGHWMDKPFERVIGENYSEDLRAAIDQAMKAPAYPPARPEYEYDEIPDFGGGCGNKARRRGESLGIDYDVAMRKDADQ